MITQPHMPPKSTGAWPRAAWALLLLAALVRLPGIDRPLVGNFATKNATYAMIARNWAAGRAPLWQPTVDCLAGGARGWHLLEVPVAAYLAGSAWYCFGGSLDAWGRGMSILFSIGSVGLLLGLMRRWHDEAAALGAATTLALAPVSVIFGQSFMLEASVVFFTLAAFWGLEQWLDGCRPRWLVVCAAALALLVLTKIYMLIVLAPLLARAAGKLRRAANQSSRGMWMQLTLALATAAAPALAWCAYAARLADPGGETHQQVYYSIRASADAHAMPHPLLASPDFYRQLLDDLCGISLTPVAFVLVLVGCLHPGWRRHAAWLAAMALLVALVPAKFYKMNYYHLVVLPPLCVMAGLGWQVVYERLRPGRLAVAGLLAVALFFSVRYSVRPAFVTPVADRAVLAAAAALRESASAEERVVTMHGTTTDLLYYCDRPGWAVSAADRQLGGKLDECRRQGAKWLVVADLKQFEQAPSAAAQLARHELVRRGDDYRVYRLLDEADRAVARLPAIHAEPEQAAASVTPSVP